jgi:hypothetical protein
LKFRGIPRWLVLGILVGNNPGFVIELIPTPSPGL